MSNCDGGEVGMNGKYLLLFPIQDHISLAENIFSLYKNQELYEDYSSKSSIRGKSFDPLEIKYQVNQLIND
jgi:hypothetical protein